jgi:hypothetical protein
MSLTPHQKKVLQEIRLTLQDCRDLLYETNPQSDDPVLMHEIYKSQDNLISTIGALKLFIDKS